VTPKQKEDTIGKEIDNSPSDADVSQRNHAGNEVGIKEPIEGAPLVTEADVEDASLALRSSPEHHTAKEQASSNLLEEPLVSEEFTEIAESKPAEIGAAHSEEGELLSSPTVSPIPGDIPSAATDIDPGTASSAPTDAPDEHPDDFGPATSSEYGRSGAIQQEELYQFDASDRDHDVAPTMGAMARLDQVEVTQEEQFETMEPDSSSQVGDSAPETSRTTLAGYRLAEYGTNFSNPNSKQFGDSSAPELSPGARPGCDLKQNETRVDDAVLLTDPAHDAVPSVASTEEPTAALAEGRHGLDVPSGNDAIVHLPAELDLPDSTQLNSGMTTSRTEGKMPTPSTSGHSHSSLPSGWAFDRRAVVPSYETLKSSGEIRLVSIRAENEASTYRARLAKHDMLWLYLLSRNNLPKSITSQGFPRPELWRQLIDCAPDRYSFKDMFLARGTQWVRDALTHLVKEQVFASREQAAVFFADIVTDLDNIPEFGTPFDTHLGPTQDSSPMLKKDDLQQSEHTLVQGGEETDMPEGLSIENDPVQNSGETSVLQGMSTSSSSQEWSLEDADQIGIQTIEDPPQDVPTQNLETPLTGQNQTPSGLRSHSISLFTISRRHPSVLSAFLSAIQRMNEFYQSTLRQRIAKQPEFQTPSQQESFEQAETAIKNRISESSLLVGELEALLAELNTPTASATIEINLRGAFETLAAEGLQGDTSVDEISTLEDMPSNAVSVYWMKIRGLLSLPPAFANIASDEERILASAVVVAYESLCCRHAMGTLQLSLQQLKTDTEVSQKLIPALISSLCQSTRLALLKARGHFRALSESIITAGSVDQDDFEVPREDGGNEDVVQRNVQVASLKKTFVDKVRNIQGRMAALHWNDPSPAVVDKDLDEMLAIVQQLQTVREPQEPPILTSNLVDSTEADMSDIISDSSVPALSVRLPYPAQHYMVRDILDSFKHVIFEYLQPRVRDLMECHGWHFPESVSVVRVVNALDSDYPLQRISGHGSSDSGFDQLPTSIKLMVQIRTQCGHLVVHKREWKSLRLLRNSYAHSLPIDLQDLQNALAHMITLARCFDSKPLIGRLEQYQGDLKNFATRHLQRQNSLRAKARARLEAIEKKRRELEQEERGVLADLHKQNLEYSVEYATPINKRGRETPSPSDAPPAKVVPQETMRELDLRHSQERERLALMLRSRDPVQEGSAGSSPSNPTVNGARLRRRQRRKEIRSASKLRSNNEPIKLEESRRLSQDTLYELSSEQPSKTLKNRQPVSAEESKGLLSNTPNPPAPEHAPRISRHISARPGIIRRISGIHVGRRRHPAVTSGVAGESLQNVPLRTRPRHLAAFQAPDKSHSSTKYKLLGWRLDSASNSTASHTIPQGTAPTHLPSLPMYSTRNPIGRPRGYVNRRPLLGVWPDKKPQPYTPHPVDSAIESFDERRARLESRDFSSLFKP
jgi:hypothetical protein